MRTTGVTRAHASSITGGVGADCSNAGCSWSDPFSSSAPAPSWAADGKQTYNNVPSSLFLLLRTEDLTASVFNCPSSNASPDNYGGGNLTAVNRCNFGAAFPTKRLPEWCTAGCCPIASASPAPRRRAPSQPTLVTSSRRARITALRLPRISIQGRRVRFRAGQRDEHGNYQQFIIADEGRCFQQLTTRTDESVYLC